MSTSLKDRTYELLIKSGLSDREVAGIVGCTSQWVRLFRTQEISKPNVDLIQRLYEHLSGEPLLKD